MEILLVCSGNILRSPLAAGYLSKVLDEIGVRDVSVSSAGTLGIEGSPADAGAVTLALERGFDIQKHRSRGLSSRDLSRADLILVMERGHLERIEEMDASAVARSRLIREFETDDQPAHAEEVADPIGAGRQALVECFEVLERCILNLAFRLKYRHGL
jgi:protein-tyrosine phosphatase